MLYCCLVSPLRRLRAQFHQQEDHKIRRNRENDHNPLIALIILVDIKRPRITLTIPISTDAATTSSIEIDETSASSHRLEVRSEVLTKSGATY